MRNFKACLDYLEIKDLRYHGPLFTWTNKQPDDPISRKLDSALINEQWIGAYLHSLAKFSATEISGHSHYCVSLFASLPTAGIGHLSSSTSSLSIQIFFQLLLMLGLAMSQIVTHLCL